MYQPGASANAFILCSKLVDFNAVPNRSDPTLWSRPNYGTTNSTMSTACGGCCWRTFFPTNKSQRKHWGGRQRKTIVMISTCHCSYLNLPCTKRKKHFQALKFLGDLATRQVDATSLGKFYVSAQCRQFQNRIQYLKDREQKAGRSLPKSYCVHIQVLGAKERGGVGLALMTDPQVSWTLPDFFKSQLQCLSDVKMLEQSKQ